MDRHHIPPTRRAGVLPRRARDRPPPVDETPQAPARPPTLADTPWYGSAAPNTAPDRGALCACRSQAPRVLAGGVRVAIHGRSSASPVRATVQTALTKCGITLYGKFSFSRSHCSREKPWKYVSIIFVTCSSVNSWSVIAAPARRSLPHIDCLGHANPIYTDRVALRNAQTPEWLRMRDNRNAAQWGHIYRTMQPSDDTCRR